MLKQRVITALLLLAVLLPVLWAPVNWPFEIFVAVTIVAAAWEWARLNGLSGAVTFVYALGTLAALVLCWFVAGTSSAWLWHFALLLWLLGGSWALLGAPSAWSRLPRALRLLLGPVVLVPAGVALASWKLLGLNALLSVLCLVWMADIAAYFGGRALGRRKLAPAISPGKSWEGVWSGMLGVLLLALVWGLWIDVQPWVDGPSLYSRLHGALGWPLTLLALLLLAALSVMGDLFESLIKRAAGAKDSSQLLPGHGGVLDRVDALLPVLPVALALVSLTGAR